MAGLKQITTSDLDQMVETLRLAIKLDDPIDAGTAGDRGGIFGTGDADNYLTHSAEAEVNESGSGSGTIRYPYVSRERHAHDIAVQKTATEDNDKNGRLPPTMISRSRARRGSRATVLKVGCRRSAGRSSA